MESDFLRSARRYAPSRRGGTRELAEPLRVTVVGGGIAGVAAATVLAERGARVTLLEGENFLGGRAGAWTERLRDGSPFEMERGFHAFFRQYYNLRRLLQRIDPQLSFLAPLDDYPIHGPNGSTQSFARLPRRTPLNIAALTWRSPAIGVRDLRHVNVVRAARMLAFDQETSYERWDDLSAKEYLDSLRFPPEARQLLFDVFAHSFFNPEEEMSAGELLMMFHFYFTGNPEGLVFDVARRPFSQCIWTPFEAKLQEWGVELRLGERASGVETRRDGFAVHAESGVREADAVVLALSVPGLKQLVAASPSLGNDRWRASVSGLDVTLPFAVWRLWLDRPCRSERTAFAGTTGVGQLDNISLYHLFEDESRAWADRSGGSVVELHAYAVPEGLDERALREDLLRGLHEIYPETREATILEDRYLLRRDCAAFRAGSDATRPEVATPIDGLVLAGDFVRLPFPSALMERAAASGFLAANELLTARGVAPEPVYTVPPRGMLAAMMS